MEMELYYDKPMVELQAAFTLYNGNRLMLKTEVDRIWQKYEGSRDTLTKIFLCLLANSEFERVLRGIRSLEPLSNFLSSPNLISNSLLETYFNFPMANRFLERVFLQLPPAASHMFLKNICRDRSYMPISPLLLRSYVKNNDELNPSELVSYLQLYSQGELIEALFHILVDYDESLLWGDSQLYLKRLTRHHHSVKISFREAGLDLNNIFWICPDNENTCLYWPFKDMECPELPLDIIAHYAHCILKVTALDDYIRTYLAPLAKEYKREEVRSSEELLECPGANEWAIIWDRVCGNRGGDHPGWRRIRASPHVKFCIWTLEPLIESLKEGKATQDEEDLKAIIHETYKMLSLPDKVLFLQKFLKDSARSDLLRHPSFVEDVKLFKNKAGGGDSSDEGWPIQAAHEALSLAFSSPREFLDILLNEVLGTGHKVFLKTLLGPLCSLLYQDPTHLKNTLINALLSVSDEKFPELLSSFKAIAYKHPLKDLHTNLANTALALWMTTFKPLPSQRMLSALKALDLQRSKEELSAVLPSLSSMFMDLVASPIASPALGRLQETLFEQLKALHQDNRTLLLQGTQNELHRRLREAIVLKDDQFSLTGLVPDLTCQLLGLLPYALPSEWRLLFQGGNEVKSLLRALSILFLSHSSPRGPQYLAQEASQGLSACIQRRRGSGFEGLYELLRDVSLFLWRTKNICSSLGEFDICLTSLINHLCEVVTTTTTKNENDRKNQLKSILVLLSFVPQSNGKSISLKKLGQLIAH